MLYLHDCVCVFFGVILLSYTLIKDAQIGRWLMFAVVDSRKKRKGGEVKGASGGKKVKKEETEEEKLLKVSTVKVKPSF